MTPSPDEDEFTREKWLSEVRWTVTLSDGTRVIQDDNRPGAVPPSAWLRLRQYTQEKSLHIVGMSLAFRDEPPVHMPDNASGYFFRKSVGSFLDSDLTYGFFLTGVLTDKEVVVQRWKVPELILVEEEVRDPENEDTVGNSLIRKIS